jgi:hypothetical protein
MILKVPQTVKFALLEIVEPVVVLGVGGDATGEFGGVLGADAEVTFS